ncbi:MULTISPECIES: hypothetical protein [unclassified Massilia]|uniref:hypothetical protein n=1 Tax=unclassified Massilia TaxID=2609279 RepID=UPI001E547030|nr:MULTISPECIES: hypothetical protein [unclassified Massilia]
MDSSHTDSSPFARLHRFAAARFSPAEAFGLHLTLGVLALLLAMTGFARLAGAVVAGAPITLVDVQLANWLHAHAHDNPLLRTAMLALTQLHSTPGMLGLTALAGWWLVRRGARHWVPALVAAVPGACC